MCGTFELLFVIFEVKLGLKFDYLRCNKKKKRNYCMLPLPSNLVRLLGACFLSNHLCF